MENSAIGDKEFEDALAKHRPGLLLYAGHLCSSKQCRRLDPEDVIQEAYMRAWRRQNQLESMFGMIGWLRTIVSNVVNDNFRGHSGRNNTALGEDALPQVSVGPTQFEEAEKAELEDKLEEKIAQLPEEFRQVIVFSLRGFGPKEMATMWNMNTITVNTRKHRGIQLLRLYFGANSYEGQPTPPASAVGVVKGSLGL